MHEHVFILAVIFLLHYSPLSLAHSSGQNVVYFLIEVFQKTIPHLATKMNIGITLLGKLWSEFM